MLNKLKPKSEFSRNVLTLMTGTTIAQAIPIAVSPILTRLYTPEDFGVFALYLGIVNFIAIVVTARYEMAIVLPKCQKEAINILALSLLITLSIVFVITFIIIFFKEFILNTLNANSLGNIIYLVPFSILLAGLAQSFNYWSNRKEYFKNMSNAQILQSVSIGVSQPLFKYIGINSGLILGNIVGRFISVIVLIGNFIKKDKTSIQYIKKEVMIEQMIKYKDFPLINSLHAFSDIIRNSGSVMLISSFFGSTVLGFYSLSLRVLQVPIGIIGLALGQVLYKKFSLLYNDNQSLYPYVKTVVVKLLLIALPTFGILFFVAPDLFAFIFGEKWRIAGEYSQMLIPYLFINFITSPISSLPVILKQQKRFFYFSLVGNIGMPLIFFIGYILDFNMKYILFILSLFMLFIYSLILFWIVKLTKGNKI